MLLLGHPRPLYVYFRSFQTQISQKTVDYSGIQTWIFGIEGEHTDHLTTTTTAPIVDVYGTDLYMWLEWVEKEVEIFSLFRMQFFLRVWSNWKCTGKRFAYDLLFRSCPINLCCSEASSGGNYHLLEAKQRISFGMWLLGSSAIRMNWCYCF